MTQGQFQCNYLDANRAQYTSFIPRFFSIRDSAESRRKEYSLSEDEELREWKKGGLGA